MDFEQELMAEKTTPNCDEYFADEDEDPTEESGHVRYLPRSLNDTSSRELKHVIFSSSKSFSMLLASTI